MSDKPTVFISYSHADERWKERLVAHLDALGNERFDVWSDERIQPGATWKAEIERALATASVAVLLISVDFLRSRFIRGDEVPPLLRRRERDHLPIVPVLVRPCAWQKIDWLSGMQVRPKGAKALSGGTEYEIEDALARIAEEVDAIVEQQKARLSAAASAGPRVATAQPPSPIVAAPAAIVAPAAPVILAPPGVTLRPFSFETVTLDERGAVRERRTLTAQSYLEDLGGGVTLEMVAIPGGTFTMGSPADEGGRREAEGPPHEVTVPPFCAGMYPVTQAQWRAVAALPRVARDLYPAPSSFKGATRPVEWVTWHDAVEFCARVQRKTGRTYRLPSEGEWEYAARAGTTTPFAFGPTITPALVNYNGNTPYGGAQNGQYREQTTDVGWVGFANAFGLFDVHGNVWEWTQDPWHDNYDGAPSDGSAWEAGGDPTRRVLRGGAWIGSAWRCRSAVRGRPGPEDRGDLWGFRVVCAVSRT